MNLARRPTEGPLDFGMASVPDQNNNFTFPPIACNLRMYLGNQRACCIEYFEISIHRLLLDFSRYPMRTENDDRFVWYFTQLIHKYSTSRTELIDHTPIVDYFVPNIDRWAIV